jgi:hypothetical protein
MMDQSTNSGEGSSNQTDTGSPGTNETGLEFPEGHGVSPLEKHLHRVGWVVFTALLLAALAGLLGPGSLSSRTAEAGPALSADYQRFVRNHAPADLRIRVVVPAGQDSIRLLVGNAFLEATELTRIKPEPDSVEVTPEGHVYVFEAPQLGAEEALILYRYQPDGAFSDVPVRIALERGPEVSFRQFVYP